MSANFIVAFEVAYVLLEFRYAFVEKRAIEQTDRSRSDCGVIGSQCRLEHLMLKSALGHLLELIKR